MVAIVSLRNCFTLSNLKLSFKKSNEYNKIYIDAPHLPGLLESEKCFSTFIYV